MGEAVFGSAGLAAPLAPVADGRPEPIDAEVPRMCCGCRRWAVLDDGPTDPGEWFGVCGDALRAALVRGTGCARVCGWIYDNGTHGYEPACDQWEEC